MAFYKIDYQHLTILRDSLKGKQLICHQLLKNETQPIKSISEFYNYNCSKILLCL